MPVNPKTANIEYLPYGETFFERRDYWNTPYKFNAKELDEETGMYYYGARYYTPEVSIWLSVDPLADKYPSMSPYSYCANSPVIFVDPDGNKIKGFSVDENGCIVVTNPSKNALRLYNAMTKTKKGVESFKEMVVSPTLIKVKIVNRALYDDEGNHIRGVTIVKEKSYDSEEGLYKKAKVIFSTNEVEDRFKGSSIDLILNIVGIHESYHLTDKEQIEKDREEPNSWSSERTPIEAELTGWIQWANTYTGNYDFLPKYSQPSQLKDGYGNTKPSYKSNEPINPPKPRWENPKGI